MKWFKHYSDAHQNLKFKAVLSRHGLAAYGLFWICDELVANQGEGNRIPKYKLWKEAISFTTRLEIEEMDKYLAFFAEIGLIDAEALAQDDLFIPKLAEYGDEYSSRPKKLPTVSGESRDNVVLDKIRIDKNRREESKPHAHLKWLIEIPEDSAKDFSKKYEASVQQVRRKGEQFHNYCVSKGKTYKDYKAALENALDKDFGRRQVYLPPVKEVVAPQTPEEKARVAEIQAQTREMLKGKRVTEAEA